MVRSEGRVASIASATASPDPTRPSRNRSSRGLVVLIFAMLLVMALTACTTPGVPPSCDKDQWPGTQGLNIDGLTSQSDAQQQATLDAANHAGARWVRVDVNWDYTEPAPGTWVYDAFDRVIPKITSRGMKVLLVMDYGVPRWANGVSDPFVPPTDPNAYGDFAAHVAARYAPYGVVYYEIWNEPNIDIYFHNPDPAKYVQLLQAAYTKIKAAVPNSIVLSGGFAPAATFGPDIAPSDFLDAMYQKGAKAYFDAVADHPYTMPVLASSQVPWGGFNDLVWNTNPYSSPGSHSMRTVMDHYGDGAKKVWATEDGAVVGPLPCSPQCGYFTEHDQAANVANMLATFSGFDWAGPMFIAKWQDATNPFETWGNHLGLLRLDGSQRPSYTEFVNHAFWHAFGQKPPASC